jgi:hypothetical protein
MAWLPLGEAVDRVLARLADQRKEKAGKVVSLPGEGARVGGGDQAPALARDGSGHGITCAKLAKTERERARRAARR